MKRRKVLQLRDRFDGGRASGRPVGGGQTLHVSKLEAKQT